VESETQSTGNNRYKQWWTASTSNCTFQSVATKAYAAASATAGEKAFPQTDSYKFADISEVGVSDYISAYTIKVGDGLYLQADADGNVTTGEEAYYWLAAPITLTDDQVSEAEQAYANAAPNATTVKELTEAGVYRIINKNYGTAICEQSNALKLQEPSYDDADFSEYWVIEQTTKGWTLSNAQTVNYMQNVGPVTTALLTPVNFTITANDGYFTISPVDTENYLWARTDAIVGSTTFTNESDLYKWQLQKLDLSPESIKTLRDNYHGWGNPAEGGTFQIVNYSYPTQAMTTDYDEEATKLTISPTTANATLATQWWTIDAENMTIKSPLTGFYIYNLGNTEGTNLYATATESKMSDFVPNYKTEYLNCYAISTGGTKTVKGNEVLNGIAQTDESNIKIWRYYNQANGTGTPYSYWFFKKLDISDEALASAKETYNLQAHATEYDATLQNYFDDRACTTLNSTYADMTNEELTAKMEEDGLPETLQEIVLKVKNESWDDNTYEKYHRIAPYMAYNAPNEWASRMKMVTFARLTNPTGIRLKAGQAACIFVDDNVPNSTTLKLETVSGYLGTTSGTQTELSPGLNVYTATKDVALFINYEISTAADYSGTYEEDFPDVTVHIEGGYINGLIDLNRLADKTDDEINEMWTTMIANGLFTHNCMQLKSKRVCYSGYNKNVTTSYCPDDIATVLHRWDWLLGEIQGIMGLEEYDGKWRNLYGFYTVKTSAAAYATTYGAYMSLGAIKDIFVADQLVKGHAIWTLGHENGHNHQDAINITGDTEVSTNLFSAVVAYKQGASLSRHDHWQDNAKAFQSGTPYYSRGIWWRYRMYYQLYEYFHMAGVDTTFYPRLFQALRSDPMVWRSNKGNPALASQSYLKFALKCCEVANADLSEFFETYGMFEYKDTLLSIGDYGTYYIKVTSEDVDSVKAKMQAYEKKAGNIMFVSDYVSQKLATYDGHAEGEYKSTWEGSYNGVMGDYEKFSTTASAATGYSYTYDADNATVTIHDTGTGAAGIKVYAVDEDGNETLIAYSNKLSFTIPSGYTADQIVVKVAGYDLSDTVIYPGYAFVVYKGSADSTEVTYLSKTSELGDNYIAVPSDDSYNDELSTMANVLRNNGTAQKIVITDKTNFYAPNSIAADSVVYERQNTALYNSVCLPFALATSDLPEESKVCIFTGVNDDQSEINFNETATSVDAGVPCLVWSPEGTEKWSITKENVTIVGEPAASVTNDNVSLIGSFQNDSLKKETGYYYKLNSAGTKFGPAMTKPVIYAFRVYLDGINTQSSVRVNFIDGTTTRIGTINSQGDGDCYDLTGRRIAHPRSGIYLKNGKKYLK